MKQPVTQPTSAHILSLPGRALRLPLFLALVGVTTAAGGGMMGSIMRAGGIRMVETFLLACFVPTFAWISMAFWSAVMGFVLQLFRRNPVTLRKVADGAPLLSLDATSGTTALVMPAHNEDPVRVGSGIRRILQSVEATGMGERFHFFLLSDTTQPVIAEEEERAWSQLRSEAAHPQRLFYRRRSPNTGRKPGNIADFCRRWGADYRYMVVLDADSVMEGPTLVELVQLMEANPRAGIIQTVPIPRGQASYFGRLLQFAGRLYGPMLATGYSFWQGNAANYWGHNAILRVAPFAEHGTLPRLSGSPPLGGEVLSHDFVEAALLRRAGWDCYLLPHLQGSFEEVPGNLVDYARRDRRWCQGSLQHLRLMGLPGLRGISRLHFFMGAMGYLSSALWLLLLLGSTAYVLLPETPAGESSGSQGFQAPISLLAVTAGILFLPRVMALMLALGRRSSAFGGSLHLVTGLMVETLFTVVVAPIMMLLHSRFVTEILAGRTVPWHAQDRDGREISWDEAWEAGWEPTVVGMVWAGVTLWHSPFFALWLSPIFVGLLLAIPIIRWSSGSGGREAPLPTRAPFAPPSPSSASGSHGN
ncbi:MAG: glucans biosynthesis glucosyltransferase MdoH [Gemmatimonadota bacterium]